MKTHPLWDAADLSNLRRILDSFCAASGIAAAVVDPAGRTIAASSGQEDPSGPTRPHQDLQKLPWNGETGFQRFEYPGGLFMYGQAIRIEEEAVGAVLLGPVRHGLPGQAMPRQPAREPDGGGASPVRTARQAASVTEEQARRSLDFLAQVVRQAAEQRLRIRRLSEGLSASQERVTELQQAYRELEACILDRTEELQRTNRSLQESEQRFRVALIDTPIIVFNQDLDLRYTWVYNLQGYTDRSILGKTDADLYSPEDAARLTALKRAVMAGRALRREEVSVTTGSAVKHYDMTLDPLFDETGAVTGIACAATDITERKQLYEQVRRRLAESESVQKIAKGLLQKIGLDEVLKIVCVEAMHLTGATGSAVLLLEEDGWLNVTHSEGVPEFPFGRVPVGESFAGRAFQTGSHVWVDLRASTPQDAAHELQGYPWIQGVSSLFIVPLKVDTRVIGVINILDKPGELTREDRRIIDLFADQAAIIIEHVRLQHQSEQLAVLEERQRLARELHDSVTQALYSVTLYADAARLALSAKRWQALETNLQEVRNMAREAMYDMRLLVFELRPFMLEKEGLVSVLRARLAAVEDRAGLQTQVAVEGERRLPIAIEEELYRIAQEGLNNVVKHAAARHARIHLRYTPGSVSLEMSDDGRGFDPETAEQSGGFGLKGIRERVHRLGGDLTLESVRGQGTRFRVTVPTP